jgi:hypothetical protein
VTIHAVLVACRFRCIEHERARFRSTEEHAAKATQRLVLLPDPLEPWQCRLLLLTKLPSAHVSIQRAARGREGQVQSTRCSQLPQRDAFNASAIYVERADIPYNAQSENSGYTALDFAQWAASREQTDTQAVQQYLKSCAQRHARGPEVVPAAQGPVSERAPGEEDIHVAQGLVPELPPGRAGSCTPERHASANSSSAHGTVDMFNGAAY